MNRLTALPFVFLCFPLLLFSPQTLSDPQANTFYDHVEWAKNAPSNAYSDPNMTLNLSDFCADNNPGCESQIRNPPQAGMSEAQLTDRSTTEFYSNDQAQAIQDGFNNNNYVLDPNDETYRLSTLGIENAYDISHGISNPYMDCNTGSQCTIEHQLKSCKQPTFNNVPCTREAVASLDIGTTRYQCPTGWTLKGTTCHGEITECRHDINNHVLDYSYSSTCHGVSYRTRYRWNGKTVSASDGYVKGAFQYNSGYNSCGIATQRRFEICGQVPVTQPATLTCDSGYTLSGAQCIKNVFTWSAACSLPGSCNKVGQSCVEGAAVRTINGIPTFRPCWKYQDRYQCSLSDTCSSLNTCQEQSRTCSLKLNGVCIEDEVSKRCEDKHCIATNMQCGDTSFCLDGDCFEEMPTTGNAFNESAAALAALAEAADGIGDPPMIFTGKGMQCTDKAFGFADCCKDSGWGTGIGLDECNSEEKALGQAKEQGVTISLGSYCASSFLGACTRKKRSYCVFDSKLARIIQQQGAKGQLGIGLGSAKHPICGAITPEQLQAIDFEKIDFSDFYGDMHEGANLPSAKEIQDRLQSAYSN